MKPETCNLKHETCNPKPVSTGQGKRPDQYRASASLFLWAMVGLAIWIAAIYFGTKLYNLIF